VESSSLIEVIRRYLGPDGGLPGPLREVLDSQLPDPRKPRGKRHPLVSLLSVLAAGVACGHRGPLAIAQAAAGWDQEVLTGHGCRICPATGLRVPPSASTLDRLPRILDAEKLEAALTGWVAPAALDPQVAARVAAQAAARIADKKTKKPRRAPAGAALREVRGDGWFRAAPGHPWLDPAVTGDPEHVPARPAVAVDGKERKLAKAGGNKKVHLLGAVTHVTGLVIGQDRVAKDGKANEVTHFKPLLEPLPLQDVLVTSDAMQTTRENARWLTSGKHAHYLLPVLGNQPGLYAALDALDWENTPVAAATSEITRGRVETRTARVLPVPEGTDFPGAQFAVLIERYVTIKKDRQWVMRNCEAVLHITSLPDADASPEDLLAQARGHWKVEHLHWLRDVVWDEDKSLIRTGNAPWVMSAIINLVITLFRLQGVTKFTEETRRNAQDPRRPLQLFGLSPG
jgi:predicted transposase YbfD/YdcC